MKGYPFLIGAALVMWGGFNHLLWLAIPLAILAEGALWTRWRVDLEIKDLKRLSQICFAATFGLALFGLITRNGAEMVRLVQVWLPLLFFPMLLAIRYSQWTQFPYQALAIFAPSNADTKKQKVDVIPVYLLGCLLSSLTRPAGSWALTVSLFFMLTALLFLKRPTAAKESIKPLILWIVLTSLAGGIGLFFHTSLVRTHSWLENQAPAWLYEYRQGNDDPYKRFTALGTVGKVKTNSRILFRVERPAGEGSPLLLREAAYDTFARNAWMSHTQGMDIVMRSPAGDWQVTPPAHAVDTQQAHIWLTLKKGNGLLPVPSGTVTIQDLSVPLLQQTTLGTLKLEDAPSKTNYRVLFVPEGVSANPPKDQDLEVAARFHNALDQVIEEGELKSLPPNETLAGMRRYFLQYFRYSLDLQTNDLQVPSVVDFLQNTRAGHCEYFATATVLIARRLGLPARYQTGFSVLEFSSLEQRYIVRAQHAHAWASVWLDGRWQDFDTTPPDWGAFDRLAHPPNQFLDAFSWLWFQWLKWRASPNSVLPSRVWLLVGLPFLLAWVGWRIRRRGIRARLTARKRLNEDLVLLETTDLFPLFEKLIRKGRVRQPHETLATWLQREFPDHLEEVNLLVDPLYRERYSCDPQGLDALEQAQKMQKQKTLMDIIR